MKRTLLTASLLLGFFLSPAPILAKTLRVGVSGSAPFVIATDGAFSGISLEIWRRIAESNHLSYELIEQKTPRQGITALDNGEIDLLIGPISITANRLILPGVDFTHPYFIGKEGVVLPLNQSTFLTRFKVFFAWAVLSSILVLIGVLFAVGSLVWLAERSTNSQQFPRRPVPGIMSGVWFALVTLTTVGYGDKAPVSRLGRAVTSVWMVTSLIAVSSLTASLASAFTLFLSGNLGDNISDPDDLRGQRGAIIQGTSGEELAERLQMRIVPAESLPDAIDHLLENKAEAVIFDQPAIRYHLNNNPDQPVELASFTLAEESYGFAVRTGDPLRTLLNVSILKLERNGTVRDIVDKVID